MQENWMYKALMLAYIYKGTTSPNPTVGAVLIDKQGKYVGCAVTKPAGGFHAERSLLSELPNEITQGGTLYVTLEPCNLQGRTPACTDIIIEKKIHKVIVAIMDPNPNIAGKGIECLKKAGIIVEVGLLEEKARLINQDFFYAIANKRPFVFSKFAVSLDGSMASYTGDSQWISSPRSRKISHILRYRSDAILVGANTVIKDNPLLTVRLKGREKILYRVILDGNARVPLDSAVLCDDDPTLWVVNKQKQEDSSVKIVMSRKNKEVFFLDSKEDLTTLLDFLYCSKNIVSLMIEGGSIVLGKFMEQGLLNASFIFYGNLFLGNGLKPFPNKIEKVNTAPVLKNIKVKMIQEQFLVFGNFQ